jgi:hypothetical protein
MSRELKDLTPAAQLARTGILTEVLMERGGAFAGIPRNSFAAQQAESAALQAGGGVAINRGVNEL